MLFEGRFFAQDWVRNFGPMPDGRRFAMIEVDPAQENENQIRVVKGWFDEVAANASE